MTQPALNIPKAGSLIIPNSHSSSNSLYGWVDGAGPSASINAAATTSGNDDLVSTSYVDMAGTGAVTSLSFNKKFSKNKTKLQVLMIASWKIVTGGTACKVSIGISIDGVAYEIASRFTNPTEVVVTEMGATNIPNIDSGSHDIQCIWKIITGTGTIRRSTGEWLNLLVKEVSINTAGTGS